MRTETTRRPTLLRLALASTLLFACGESPEPKTDREPGAQASLVELGPSFVDDPATRRAALEASLVNPANGYSQLRLRNYGLGDTGWDALPVRNYPVRPTTLADLSTEASRDDRSFRPVFDPESFEWTDDTLVELGRRAFHEYPLDVDPTLAAAFESTDAAEELGLWEHDGRLGGFVKARLPDGSEAFASTCASCHASVVDGMLVDGRTNARIDRDGIRRRFHGDDGSGWGPGRVDVTPDGQRNPTAITDLRPIRHQSRLHWAATLYNSPAALAVRVETLMITSADESMRPPREVAVAIAHYLWSLGEEPSRPAEETRGADLFRQHCASCHFTDGTTAPPVPLASIGTDLAVGSSPMRGTGFYRIPSLYRVGERSQFLHEGRVYSLSRLFDPGRLADVPGHVHGTTLEPDDREALIAFLNTL